MAWGVSGWRCGGEGSHHLGGGLEPPAAGQRGGLGPHLGADRVVAREHVGGRYAAGHQLPSRGQQGIAGEIGLDRRRRPVADLGVRAGVPAVPDRPQMQEDRLPVGPHVGDRVRDRRPRGGWFQPVSRVVAQTRTVAVRPLDPAGRRRHRDAQPVVLADEQDRDRQAAERGVQGGVDRADRGRVVRGGVAERAHHHGVGGIARIDPHPAGPVQRHRQPDRPRQVRGDRGRLRDDVQLPVPEHLVPPARDRLVGQSHQSLQHIPDAGRTRQLRRPGQIERPRPVVQQGRVGQSEFRRHQCVGLVPRRADRVEPFASGLQLPGHHVEPPARHLCLEHPPPAAHAAELSACRSALSPILSADNSEMGRRRAASRASSGPGGVRAMRPQRRYVVSGVSSTVSIWAFCSRPE